MRPFARRIESEGSLSSRTGERAIQRPGPVFRTPLRLDRSRSRPFPAMWLLGSPPRRSIMRSKSRRLASMKACSRVGEVPTRLGEPGRCRPVRAMKGLRRTATLPQVRGCSLPPSYSSSSEPGTTPSSA
ncbi:hypothetical protein Mterra_03274 [Calidithermus terrae]|uniref:Uncharacterized protein n=1 Tax=Calidithermus terrae TaxID=1408545 RepID=A0A399EDM8_9DEIN|nr:hypothetical protein Mterra_03274 [Calidithermus terrae]